MIESPAEAWAYDVKDEAPAPFRKAGASFGIREILYAMG